MKIRQYLLVGSSIIFLGMSVVSFADHDDHEEEEHHQRQDRKIAVKNDPLLKEECGSCHMVYPAGLLPARSWNAMMDQLKNHFGENASLEKSTEDKIRKLLTESAADQSNLRRSKKINQSISSDIIPLRISETKYFLRKHDEIKASVWKRKAVGSAANCTACHKNAEQGDFDEDSVRIPR